MQSHPARLMILVAGPYRSGTGDDPAKLAANVAGSVRIGDAAFDEVFHPIAERLLERCDALLRVGGPSEGADRLVAVARARGLVVYHALREVPGCATTAA